MFSIIKLSTHELGHAVVASILGFEAIITVKIDTLFITLAVTFPEISSINNLQMLIIIVAGPLFSIYILSAIRILFVDEKNIGGVLGIEAILIHELIYGFTEFLVGVLMIYNIIYVPIQVFRIVVIVGTISGIAWAVFRARKYAQKLKSMR